MRNLYDMVTYLQKGTQLHIGVLFFGDYGNAKCELPHEQQIHSGDICEELKNRNEKGYRRCFACRNLALKKALREKAPFGGYCINGVYEYTHPVVLEGEVACVIFIGNILDDRKKITQRLAEKAEMLATMEAELKERDCQTIAELLEDYIRMLLVVGKEQKRENNPLIENIKNYMQSNLEFEIEIADIAEVFHYNKLYLGRLFKKETGLSMKDYMITQRVERAKRLLETTDNTILEIAMRVGFNHVTYFNRVFRRVMDMTPTEYREKMKKEKP